MSQIRRFCNGTQFCGDPDVWILISHLKISLTTSVKSWLWNSMIKDPHIVDRTPMHSLKMHLSCLGFILLSYKKCQFLCLFLFRSRWVASFTQGCSGMLFHFNQPPVIIPLKYINKILCFKNPLPKVHRFFSLLQCLSWFNTPLNKRS